MKPKIVTEFERTLEYITYIKIQGSYIRNRHFQRYVVLILIYLSTAIRLTPGGSTHLVDTRWQYTFTHKQYTEHHN
jgi:hypothetical protein